MGRIKHKKKVIDMAKKNRIKVGDRVYLDKDKQYTGIVTSFFQGMAEIKGSGGFTIRDILGLRKAKK